MLTGALVLALPVTVISANFGEQYAEYNRRREAHRKIVASWKKQIRINAEVQKRLNSSSNISSNVDGADRGGISAAAPGSGSARDSATGGTPSSKLKAQLKQLVSGGGGSSSSSRRVKTTNARASSYQQSNHPRDEKATALVRDVWQQGTLPFDSTNCERYSDAAAGPGRPAPANDHTHNSASEVAAATSVPPSASDVATPARSSAQVRNSASALPVAPSELSSLAEAIRQQSALLAALQERLLQLSTSSSTASSTTAASGTGTAPD